MAPGCLHDDHARSVRIDRSLRRDSSRRRRLRRGPQQDVAVRPLRRRVERYARQGRNVIKVFLFLRKRSWSVLTLEFFQAGLI
jgi:hypothetical protein